jgi:hypothetical protein
MGIILHDIIYMTLQAKSSLGNRVQDGHPTPGDSNGFVGEQQLCFRTAESAKGANVQFLVTYVWLDEQLKALRGCFLPHHKGN